MAIVKTIDTVDELALKISNGDLSVLKQIKERWRFRNIEDIIRFALAVMIKADNHTLTILDNGKASNLSPADNLLEPQVPTTPTSSP